MDRDEFRQALRRNRVSVEEFAGLIGRTRDTVYRFGEGTPVPQYARTMLRLLDERGGVHGLIGQESANMRGNGCKIRRNV